LPQAVDEASIISHLNAKGVFSLSKLQLDDYATMRSFSRLLAGAQMEPKSRMLEHTLVYSGEVTQAGSSWQGWPAECVGHTLIEEAEYKTYSTLRSEASTIKSYAGSKFGTEKSVGAHLAKFPTTKQASSRRSRKFTSPAPLYASADEVPSLEHLAMAQA